VIKYVLVGGVVFVFYFSLIYLFVDIFDLYYQIGVSVSYFAAVALHFYLNKTFTFGESQVSVRYQFVRYLCLLCINYVIMLCVVSYVSSYLKFSPYLGALIGIFTTTFVGFVMSKYWIFSKKDVETYD